MKSKYSAEEMFRIVIESFTGNVTQRKYAGGTSIIIH